MKISKILFLLGLTTLINCCENPKNKKSFYFSSKNNCSEQSTNFNNNGKKSLYFFDSKGMMDKEYYEKSPSYSLLKRLRIDSSFNDYASKKFDFFVFDQNCDSGRIKSKSLNITMTPTILLVDENEKVIFKRIGLTSPKNLIEDIKKTLNTKKKQ